MGPEPLAGKAFIHAQKRTLRLDLKGRQHRGRFENGDVISGAAIGGLGIGDGQFGGGDAGEIELHTAWTYDWFWNMFGTYDQYKSIAGDINGDGQIGLEDGDHLVLTESYGATYDMIYGGEIY